MEGVGRYVEGSCAEISFYSCGVSHWAVKFDEVDGILVELQDVTSNLRIVSWALAIVPYRGPWVGLGIYGDQRVPF